jgi:hypothetical protein
VKASAGGDVVGTVSEGAAATEDVDSGSVESMNTAGSRYDRQEAVTNLLLCRVDVRVAVGGIELNVVEWWRGGGHMK